MQLTFIRCALAANIMMLLFLSPFIVDVLNDRWSRQNLINCHLLCHLFTDIDSVVHVETRHMLVRNRMTSRYPICELRALQGNASTHKIIVEYYHTDDEQSLPFIHPPPQFGASEAAKMDVYYQPQRY